MSEPLRHVTVESRLPAKACIIWLHGLGADGHDFAPIVPQLTLGREDVRFIFPHAPLRPITLNLGMMMPAWFDMSDVSRHRGIDMEGVEQSALAVQYLIEQQNAQGIASDKIVVMGFSQGGGIALYVGLSYAQKLAGIGALSTFLPHPESYALQPHTANQETPILFCHGTGDLVISLKDAKASVADLTRLGYQVEWHEYPMAHSVCGEELQDISRWLRTVLA
jgi:phospholipase/carboxylesterase